MNTLIQTLMGLVILNSAQASPAPEQKVFAMIPTPTIATDGSDEVTFLPNLSASALPFLVTPTAGSSTSSSSSKTTLMKSQVTSANVNVSVSETANILSLVNAERTKLGLQPLKRNPLLDAAALIQARNMHEQNFFNHVGVDGSTPLTRIRATGYLDVSGSKQWSFAVAENIAKGQPNAAKVMRDWMQSPKHRANILNKDFRDIGIALYAKSWVQTFGFINK